MIQKDMYGNFEWSSRPKLMLQSFGFFDENDEVKTHLKDESKHQKIVDTAKEKYQHAKEKVLKLLHKEA